MEKQNLKEIAEAMLYSIHLKANSQLMQSILKESYKEFCIMQTLFVFATNNTL